jgi:soluble lytic murein transglycosylase-like protein
MIRMAAIGVSILATLEGAKAQDTLNPPRLVDAAGRVLPLDTPQRIDSASNAIAPCAGATAMAPDEARALVARIATEENFYPEFVQSVAKIESHFNSVALSDKGAFGLMQLKPQTAQRFKVNLCDPAENVRGGIRYLRALHEKFHNPFFMLAAYNAGEGAVEQSRGVPAYPETVRFVADVINDFYIWPAPGGTPRRDPRGQIAHHPDLIEPGPTDAGPQTAARTPPPQTNWSDGFVMHVD